MRRVEIGDIEDIKFNERIKVSCVYYIKEDESDERKKELIFRDVDKGRTYYLLGDREVQVFDSLHVYGTLGDLVKGMWEDLEKFIDIVRFEFFDFRTAEAYYLKNKDFKI